MRIHAYVTSETCRLIDAALPGDYVGREKIPVSRHADYQPWRHSRRATLRLITESDDYYTRHAARAVAKAHGWMREDAL